MPTILNNITLSAPAFAGVNTQESPTEIDHTYAVLADNCVIDKYGRIGARKGWSYIEEKAVDVTAISEYVFPDGDTLKIYCGGLKIYKEGGIDITPSGATIVSDDWKIVENNNILYLAAAGNDPLVIYQSGSTVACSKLSAHPTASGSLASCNELLGAYGRVWAASFATDTSTLFWSDLLIGCAWNTGSAGAIDLSKVWADGSDDIMAITDHNDYLVVFGTRQILMYRGAKQPETMEIADKIVGTGCIARDSVQRIGNDVLFLSSSGVKSLNRTIQEKSVPLRDVSLNIRDEMIEEIGRTTKPIKSVYSEQFSFYLIKFDNKAYVFNLSGALTNGAFRATTWSGAILGNCFYQTKRKSILIGKRGVAYYNGYLDGTATYNMKFYTGWLSFGDNYRQKFLKKIGLLSIDGNGEDVIVRWAYDYNSTYRLERYQIPSKTFSEFGVGKYNLGVFDSGNKAYKATVNTNGAGSVVQVGVEVKINGNPFSLQRMDIYATIGANR